MDRWRKLYLLLNHLGLVVAWDVDTANVYDGSAFQHLVEAVAEDMLVFADPHFAKSGWNSPNLKICAKGTWNDRMMIEMVYNPPKMDSFICQLLSSAYELAPKVE